MNVIEVTLIALATFAAGFVMSAALGSLKDLKDKEPAGDLTGRLNHKWTCLDHEHILYVASDLEALSLHFLPGTCVQMEHFKDSNTRINFPLSRS